MPSKLFVLLFICCISAKPQKNITEIYSGEFRYGNFATQLILEIDRNKDFWQVHFSSPEQNAYRIPAREIVIGTDSIAFVLQSDSFRYEFAGAFKQESLAMELHVDNKDFPFSLTRASAKDQNKLESQDVSFRSGDLLLYGTVYFPKKPNGKAIYLATSSGDQDRSASRAEAQFLAGNGYITFHADKRGTGLSEGRWQNASIPELCVDDMHAIRYLANTNNLSYSSIGIKGSSQGASKVPYILSKMPELGFGVLVSCPASTLLESDLNYWKNTKRNELSEDELMQAAQIQRSVFLFIAGEISKNELKNELDSVSKESWMSHVWVPELDSVRIDKKLSYTPVPYLQQIVKPLLVIQGSSDEIIPKNSLNTIRGLTENGNAQNHYIELKQADHAMMFRGKSDFPYWPALHPEYRIEMLKWLDALHASRK